MIPPALFLSYRNPGPRARPACQAHLGSLESHGRGGVQFMPPPDITEMLCHQPEVTCHASGPLAWDGMRGLDATWPSTWATRGRPPFRAIHRLRGTCTKRGALPPAGLASSNPYCGIHGNPTGQRGEVRWGFHVSMSTRSQITF